jgi:hypothetical protein
VASVFDRLVGQYMIGALSFSLFLKIGPVPTPGTPRFTAAWPELDASRLSRWRSKQSGSGVILE